MSESQGDRKSGSGEKVIDAEVEPLGKAPRRRMGRLVVYLILLVLVSIAIAVLYHLWSTDRLGQVFGGRSSAPAAGSSSVTLPVSPPPQAAVPPIASPVPAPAEAQAQPEPQREQQPDPRIDELERRLAALTASIERLQQLPAPASVDQQTITELQNRLQALEAERAEQDQKIALLIQASEAQGSQRGSLQQQVADLQARLTGVAQQSTAALREPLAQLIAWSELRDRARRGERFTGEAAILLPYAERQGAALQQAASALQGFADAPPPSLLQLHQRFAPLLQQQLDRPVQASGDPAEKTVWQRALDKITGLVTIRKVGGAGEAAPETKLADAEAAMAAGDVDAALAALEGLQLDPDLAAWREAMKARLALDAALDAYGAALRAHLAALP